MVVNRKKNSNLLYKNIKIHSTALLNQQFKTLNVYYLFYTIHETTLNIRNIIYTDNCILLPR